MEQSQTLVSREMGAYFGLICVCGCVWRCMDMFFCQNTNVRRIFDFIQFCEFGVQLEKLNLNSLGRLLQKHLVVVCRVDRLQ